MSFFTTKGVHVGLYISTPEEIRKGYENTKPEDVKKHRLKEFDKFVKDWKVEYFFNQGFKWDIARIADVLPGLSDLLDHSTAFTDVDGNFFLLMQPYNHVNPGNFCKENKIRSYVKYWSGGFHNPATYAIVISGDFLTYVQNHLGELMSCGGWRNYDASMEQCIVDRLATIKDIHN